MLRNGSSTGSLPHTASSSQYLVAPSVYPCCEVNHCSKIGFEVIQLMNFLAACWFFEYPISMLVNGPGRLYWPPGPLGNGACSMSWYIGVPFSVRYTVGLRFPSI